MPTTMPEPTRSRRPTERHADARRRGGDDRGGRRPALAEASPAAATTAVNPPRRRSPFGLFRRTAGGVGAVGVKELRGRMRGRRAFVILTLYLVLLAGFAWMVELIMERTYATGFGGNATFATAAIGQGIFVVDPDARDPARRLPRPDGDGRGDQPRAREADPRDARRDADHVGRRSSSASCSAPSSTSGC